MGLFDRFRTQPKWKHADAAVRLAGVEEIALDEQGVLAALAREDADARVRRAAIRKLYDPAVLEDVSARDADAEVRDEAGRVLLDLAVGAFEDSTEAESLKALDHLGDPRHLVTVAKGASAEAVSLAALSRLTDVKAIGSVARRADHASTRLEALARVDDAEEILAIALRSEHRDVAVAAVERLTSAEHLKAVAERATLKPVARRARALARAHEEAEAPAQATPAAEPPAPAAPDWNAARDRAWRVVEDTAAEHDWRAVEDRVAAAEAQWANIDGEAGGTADADRAARFWGACERARQRAARLKEDEATRAERMEQAARQHSERVAACERAEALVALIARRTAGGAGDGVAVRLEDVPAEVARARQAWAALDTPLVAADEIERFDRRFDRACVACEREADRCRAAEANRARMTELVQQAEGFAGHASSDRALWPAVRQEWADLGGTRIAGESLAARFEAAQATIAKFEAEAHEQEQQRQREAVQRVAQTCERLEAAARTETLSLKDGEHALRDVRAALDAVGSLPKKDRPAMADRLKALQSALFPRVQELRESDEWVRWANVGIQERLCEQAEALGEVADPAEAMRQLQGLQQQWKQASAVPRDRARQLWERFKQAGDQVHARADAYFAQQGAERAANLTAKESLCQQAEALAESSDWIKTADTIKQLQVQWKAIGPVPRGHEKAVWERFRAACDRFFTRRREDLVRRKEEWAANLARKEALIAQAEALGETTADWDRAADEIRRLQSEWKTVGAVRKNRSEDVWQRFRAAVDRFSERYQQRDRVQVDANVAARETICQELDGLLPPADAPQPASAPDDLAARVAGLRARWQQAPSLMARETLAAFKTRFNETLLRLVTAFPDAFRGSDLDLDAACRRAEDLCAKVEAVLPDEHEQPPAASPTEILAARLREALAANTMGAVAVAEADAKWKAAAAAVKAAQADWAALPPLPAETAAPLAERFERACRRVATAVERRKR